MRCRSTIESRPPETANNTLAPSGNRSCAWIMDSTLAARSLTEIIVERTGPANKPELRRRAAAIAQLFKAAQEFDEVPDVLLRHDLAKFLRHPGETALAGFDFRFL